MGVGRATDAPLSQGLSIQNRVVFVPRGGLRSRTLPLQVAFGMM